MHCILPDRHILKVSQIPSNLRGCCKDLQQEELIYYKQEDEKCKGPAKIIGIDRMNLVVSQGGGGV